MKKYKIDNPIHDNQLIYSSLLSKSTNNLHFLTNLQKESQLTPKSHSENPLYFVKIKELESTIDFLQQENNRCEKKSLKYQKDILRLKTQLYEENNKRKINNIQYHEIVAQIIHLSNQLIKQSDVNLDFLFKAFIAQNNNEAMSFLSVDLKKINQDSIIECCNSILTQLSTNCVGDITKESEIISNIALRLKAMKAYNWEMLDNLYESCLTRLTCNVKKNSMTEIGGCNTEKATINKNKEKLVTFGSDGSPNLLNYCGGIEIIDSRPYIQIDYESYPYHKTEVNKELDNDQPSKIDPSDFEKNVLDNTNFCLDEWFENNKPNNKSISENVKNFDKLPKSSQNLINNLDFAYENQERVCNIDNLPNLFNFDSYIGDSQYLTNCQVKKNDIKDLVERISSCLLITNDNKTEAAGAQKLSSRETEDFPIPNSIVITSSTIMPKQKSQNLIGNLTNEISNEGVSSTTNIFQAGHSTNQTDKNLNLKNKRQPKTLNEFLENTERGIQFLINNDTKGHLSAKKLNGSGNYQTKKYENQFESLQANYKSVMDTKADTEQEVALLSTKCHDKQEEIKIKEKEIQSFTKTLDGVSLELEDNNKKLEKIVVTQKQLDATYEKLKDELKYFEDQEKGLQEMISKKKNENESLQNFIEAKKKVVKSSEGLQAELDDENLLGEQVFLDYVKNWEAYQRSTSSKSPIIAKTRLEVSGSNTGKKNCFLTSYTNQNYQQQKQKKINFSDLIMNNNSMQKFGEKKNNSMQKFGENHKTPKNSIQKSQSNTNGMPKKKTSLRSQFFEKIINTKPTNHNKIFQHSQEDIYADGHKRSSSYLGELTCPTRQQSYTKSRISHNSIKQHCQTTDLSDNPFASYNNFYDKNHAKADNWLPEKFSIPKLSADHDFFDKSKYMVGLANGSGGRGLDIGPGSFYIDGKLSASMFMSSNPKNLITECESHFRVDESD